jgi:hypothetical protein
MPETKPMIIPEQDWHLVETLTRRILQRVSEQEEDIRNLNNLLHALHGEGIRAPEYTNDGRHKVFVDGKWVDR